MTKKKLPKFIAKKVESKEDFESFQRAYKILQPILEAWSNAQAPETFDQDDLRPPTIIELAVSCFIAGSLYAQEAVKAMIAEAEHEHKDTTQ